MPGDPGVLDPGAEGDVGAPGVGAPPPGEPAPPPDVPPGPLPSGPLPPGACASAGDAARKNPVSAIAMPALKFTTLLLEAARGRRVVLLVKNRESWPCRLGLQIIWRPGRVRDSSRGFFSRLVCKVGVSHG